MAGIEEESGFCTGGRACLEMLTEKSDSTLQGAKRTLDSVATALVPLEICAQFRHSSRSKDISRFVQGIMIKLFLCTLFFR